MWESPIYKFSKKIYGDKGKVKGIDVIVDVTGSAPTMSKPGEHLEDVFKVLIKNKLPKKTKILDVGAAKLRNTLYLLKKGFWVYAVEFPELAQRMPQAKTNWEKTKHYPNFKKIIFPKDFFKLGMKEVDIILLINVINIMPIPDERLALLSLCREKIKNNGLLLWYGWRDISSKPEKYTEKNKLNDGYFKGKERKHKTFHGEWNKEHVLEMLISSGFSRNEKFRLSNVGNNQAFIFSPDQPKLLDSYLHLSEIKKGRKRRNPNTTIFEVEKTNFPLVYSKELEKVLPGPKEATKFHRLSARLLATIFDHQLKNPEIEKEFLGGLGRIDIKFQNRNKPGFLKDIIDTRHIKCPSVMVECKNYSNDVKNPEVDQLAARLNPKRGQFGILVCRKIAKKRDLKIRCVSKLAKDEYIIVLDDKDIKNLVTKKTHEGNEAVDDYMYKKIEEIVDLT